MKEWTIAEGGTAALNIFELHSMMFLKKNDNIVQKQWKRYCALDTNRYVWIVEKLNKLVK